MKNVKNKIISWILLMAFAICNVPIQDVYATDYSSAAENIQEVSIAETIAN